MYQAQKKVVIFSTFLSPFRSGAEAMVEEVAKRLVDDFSLTIVTARLSRSLPRSEVWKTENGSEIPILRVGKGSSFDKWLFPFLAPLTLVSLKPDIVHAVLESYAGLALSLSRLTSPLSKKILTLQSTNTTFLLPHLHCAAHVLTAISSTLVSRAKQFGRFDVHLIPNGIHFEDISRVASSIPKKHSHLLFVGRLEKMKGVDVLLHALSLLLKKDPSLSWHLSIVGDGSQTSSLHRIASDLQLDGHVSFRGRITGEALLSEYAQAEIFCGLSRSEALGNVFLEAQAANCAIVATNVGGIPDIVHHGVTGILVPPDDAVATMDALFLLLTDRVRLEAMINTSREALKRYDWDVIAEEYARLY